MRVYNIYIFFNDRRILALSYLIFWKFAVYVSYRIRYSYPYLCNTAYKPILQNTVLLSTYKPNTWEVPIPDPQSLGGLALNLEPEQSAPKFGENLKQNKEGAKLQKLCVLFPF